MKEKKKKIESKEELEKKKEIENKRKNDKIFNNTYYQGDNLKGDDYEMNKDLKIAPDYSSSFLTELHNPNDSINYKKILEEIIYMLDNNEVLIGLLKDNKKKKFNKENINVIFKEIYDHISNKKEIEMFVNMIYVFDIISNITGLKYKNLFDLLNYEYKELVIEELDNSHDILSSYKNFKKMF